MIPGEIFPATGDIVLNLGANPANDNFAGATIVAGGTVTGAYTAAHPEHIAKLVLIAPQWLSDGPPRIVDTGSPER